MKEIVAVESMTLVEVSEMFRRSIEAAMPMAGDSIWWKMKKLNDAKVGHHKWKRTYEIFKCAKLNFYCQKTPMQDNPIISIGMSHRTPDGMILMMLDRSNGGMTGEAIVNGRSEKRWLNWVHVYSAHCCQRYAERIKKQANPTFLGGSESIMYADHAGPL